MYNNKQEGATDKLEVPPKLEKLIATSLPLLPSMHSVAPIPRVHTPSGHLVHLAPAAA